MRIPTNSNFSKEIAKQFKQIFHRDMTLGGIQDLQEELNLINPVDTYLQMDKKLPKLQMQYDKFITKEKDLLKKLLAIKEKKKVTAWKLHQIKYHQATL